MKGWHRIKHCPGYHTCWKLEGEELKDGDSIAVTWPDSTCDNVMVTVQEDRYEGSGGMDESTMTKLPFLVVNYRCCIQALVPVRDVVDLIWARRKPC